MASGGSDSIVVVWHRNESGSWDKEQTLKHAEGVISVSFSPDDAVLGTSSSDNNARIYEAGGGWDELARIKGHQDEANGLSFMSAGPRLTMGMSTTSWLYALCSALNHSGVTIDGLLRVPSRHHIHASLRSWARENYLRWLAWLATLRLHLESFCLGVEMSLIFFLPSDVL